MSASTLERARYLRDKLGLSVTCIDHPDDPVHPNPKDVGKRPIGSWEDYQRRHMTDDELFLAFGNGHRRNVGIVCGRISGVVCVDADGPEAVAWCNANLPPTSMATRTAKGVHRYYRHPGDGPVPSKVRVRPAGAAMPLSIDLRGDGGQAVAPYSTHPSGFVYEKLGPWPPVDQLPVFDRAWFDLEPPAEVPLPEPGEIPADRAVLVRRAAAYVAKVDPAVEGQGGDAHTYRLAAVLVRDFALTDGEALPLLRDWNRGCVPPWTDGELAAKLRNARRYGRHPEGTKAADRPRPVNGKPFAPNPAADTTGDAAPRFARTDLGNAEAFAAAVGERARFDHRRGLWLLYEGHRWRPDADGGVWRLLRDETRARLRAATSITDEVERRLAIKWAMSSEGRPRLEAALALATRLRPIADAGEDWDADPFLLGVENGVVDLRTGTLRPGRPADRITRACAAPFVPGAPADRWERFVDEVLCQVDENGHVDEAGTLALAGFVHRALGYSLTGATSEQVLWLLHGAGSNGKSLLLEVVADVLGDYAYAAPFSTFVHQPNPGGVPNDLAALEGRRFVICTEATDGVRLNEPRLKAFSGGDTMSARFMRAEFFTLRPVGKVWLAFNRKPVVRDDSHGFWRRVRMVPFRRTFPSDGGLRGALLAERAGILRWLVEGCLAWQRDGLGLPDAVREATDSYRADSDPIREFLDTVADTSDALAETTAADLFAAYLEWADVVKLSDRERLTRTMFGRLAGERLRKRRTRHGVRYVGFRARPRHEWQRDEVDA